MENHTEVTPENLMRLATGAWAAGVVGAAVQHGVFSLLEGAPATAGELASKAGVSRRGALALLDGLLGLGLVRLQAGRYSNSPESSAFLVEGRQSYMGGFLKCEGLAMEPWMRLGDIVRSGEPLGDQQAPDPGFFEELVPAIAPLSMPAAQLAATELRLASAGPISILDIGGGSGVFDAVWLRANPLATATQIDFPNVNRVAREYVGRFGVGDRFRTVDGDFHTTDLGVRVHDVAIYSHIAHMESVEQNAATLRRIHASLKPAGSLVLNDFVLEDDRSGPPFPLLFHANMLVKTRGGSVYRAADYRAWLQESGFRDVRFVVPPGPSTLVFARA